MEGRPLDDESELIERARGGDLGAYEQLVERHQEVAVRVAHVMGGSTDAGDVAQEAFVKAWRALPRFRADAPFRPWLLRIVANEARNARRAAGRRARLVVRASGRRASGDAASSPEEAVLADERRRTVAAALESLSEADREVLACRYLAGLSEREAAAALHCRPGTVKSRTSRAVARLRATLAATGELANLAEVLDG